MSTKESKKVKCPWCGRLIGFSKKGNLMNHLQSPKIQCVGNGQPKHTVLNMLKKND